MTNNSIRAFWYMSNNFGDNANFFLLNTLSKKEPIYAYDRTEPHYICCGSILAEANEQSTVWGAGFGDSYEGLCKEANIISVRGKLSANIVQEITGKEVQALGDPCLLMKALYPPDLLNGFGKKYERAIIPHWSEMETYLNMEDLDGAHIINPLMPLDHIIFEILQSEAILCSSLHGLILSDVFGVKNKWIRLYDNELVSPFKFQDYYSVTHNPDETFTESLSWEGCGVNEYAGKLDELLKSCPFYAE